MPSDLMNTVGTALQTIVALCGAFLVAFWIALVLWTFRDMRARSRDIFATLLATLLVLIFGPIGLGLYLLLRPRETLAEHYERMLEEETLLRDMEDQPVCPTCQHKLQPDWMLCPHCTTQLRRPCESCGRLLDMGWKICPYCAQVPVNAAAPEAVAPPAPTPTPVRVPAVEGDAPPIDEGRWARPTTRAKLTPETPAPE